MAGQSLLITSYLVHYVCRQQLPVCGYLHYAEGCNVPQTLHSFRMGRRPFIPGTYLSYFHRNGKQHKGQICGDQYVRIRAYERLYPVRYLCVCIPLIHKASYRRQNPHKPAKFCFSKQPCSGALYIDFFVQYSVLLCTQEHTQGIFLTYSDACQEL